MKTETYTIKNPSTSESVMQPSDSGSVTSSSSSSARRINVSPTQPSDVMEPSAQRSDGTEPFTTSAASKSPRQSLDDLIKVSVCHLNLIHNCYTFRSYVKVITLCYLLP